MVLTRETDAVIESAGLSVRDTGSGYVLSAKGDAAVLFANSPLRILSLYTAAAALGAEVSLDTLLAANANAKSIAGVVPSKVYAAVNGILMSQHPEALAALSNAGGLEAFGIGTSSSCIHVLESMPQHQTARWWAFIHIMDADVNNVCKKLCVPQKLAYSLSVYDKLWRTATPKTMQQLKLTLAPLPRFDAGLAYDTFALFDTGRSGASGLYAQLLASNEPYRMKQLEVTAPELLIAGVPRRKISRVMKQLLTAVCKAPQLNNYPALCTLAVTLSRSM